VKTSPTAKTVAEDGAIAIAAAMRPPGQVATLILPGDTAWDEGSGPAKVPAIPERAKVSEDAVKEAARVLRSGEPALLLLTGLALREKGLELAARIAGNAPLALAKVKQVLRETQGLNDTEAFTRQAEDASSLLDTEDAHEGALAFAEKRAPVWRGR